MFDMHPAKLDFLGKLRQPSLQSRISDYVQWQCEVRMARATGDTVPKMPDQAPISINLDLTTACNYACTHCIDWDVLNTGMKHDHEELLHSLEHMAQKGLRSVILIGGGEPTVHPKFLDVLRHLKKLSLQVAIVSNGSRNETLLDAIPHMGEGDWIRLSLDSGSDATFQKMHAPKKPITLDEICAWVPRLREKNPKVPVGFSFIITWSGAEREKNAPITSNLDEIVMATKRACDYRFSYISFKPFLTRRETGAEVMDPEVATEGIPQVVRRIRAAIEEAKTYQTDEFRVVESLNLRVFEEGSWKNYTRQPAMCHMQFFRQVLSPLGLFNCSGYRGVAKAKIAEKNAYVSIKRTADTQQETAAILDRFNAEHECAEVTCLYNSANWWIEKAITEGIELDTAIEQHDFYL